MKYIAWYTTACARSQKFEILLFYKSYRKREPFEYPLETGIVGVPDEKNAD